MKKKKHEMEKGTFYSVTGKINIIDRARFLFDICHFPSNVNYS